MRKSNMEMTVGFLPGTSIQGACTEAKEFAIKFNLAFCRFEFNGVKCNISQNANIEIACEKFLAILSDNTAHKYFVE